MTVDVGPVEDFTEGTIRVVRAAGREIGIVRWAGAFYAVNNVCSHQSGPVCAGVLGPRLTGGGPGAIELDPTMPVLACPWHGWEFDVRTGRALHDVRHSIRTFPARLYRDRVVVELPA